LATSELKKGSAELLILSLLAAQGPRHGYELSKLIEARSAGAVRFNVASLYPVLYKLEAKGWVQARWVEKPGQRRRRFYRLTAAGTRVLKQQRRAWEGFVGAVRRVIGPDYA
jgi:transcriptional regulator